MHVCVLWDGVRNSVCVCMCVRVWLQCSEGSNCLQLSCMASWLHWCMHFCVCCICIIMHIMNITLCTTYCTQGHCSFGALYWRVSSKLPACAYSFLYTVQFLYIYIYMNTYVRVASRNRTLGTLKRNGFFAISIYLHAFCTILRGLVALSTSVTKK